MFQSCYGFFAQKSNFNSEIKATRTVSSTAITDVNINTLAGDSTAIDQKVSKITALANCANNRGEKISDWVTKHRFAAFSWEVIEQRIEQNLGTLPFIVPIYYLRANPALLKANIVYLLYTLLGAHAIQPALQLLRMSDSKIAEYINWAYSVLPKLSVSLIYTTTIAADIWTFIDPKSAMDVTEEAFYIFLTALLLNSVVTGIIPIAREFKNFLQNGSKHSKKQITNITTLDCPYTPVKVSGSSSLLFRALSSLQYFMMYSGINYQFFIQSEKAATRTSGFNQTSFIINVAVTFTLSALEILAIEAGVKMKYIAKLVKPLAAIALDLMFFQVMNNAFENQLLSHEECTAILVGYAMTYVLPLFNVMLSSLKNKCFDNTSDTDVEENQRLMSIDQSSNLDNDSDEETVIQHGFSIQPNAGSDFVLLHNMTDSDSNTDDANDSQRNMIRLHV